MASDEEDPLYIGNQSGSYEESDNSDSVSLQDDSLSVPILYHCTKCSYQTPRRYKLKEHLVLGCNLRPASKNQTEIKKELITSGRRFKCEYCELFFLNLHDLKKHKKAHAKLITAGLIECSQCDATFFTLKECKKHLESFHQKNANSSARPNIKKTKCTYCDLVDTSKAVIYTHTKQHHRLEKCIGCKVSIRGMYQLILHDFVIHKNVNVVPLWNLRCALCSYEGNIYSCYDHLNVHLRKKVTFQIIRENHVFGFVNLHRATSEKSELPKSKFFEQNEIMTARREEGDMTKKATPKEPNPKRFRCRQCEFTSKFRRAIKVHTTTYHQKPELTCSICKAKVKGDFKLFCHKYLIHNEIEKVSKWLLKCTQCQYQGYATQSYEHGKEHRKGMVSFKAIFDGSKRELVTFRYSRDIRSMEDAILKEFKFDTEEIDDEVEENYPKELEIKGNPSNFICPIKYCLFDTESKDDMKIHLKTLHNINRKSELDAKFEMAKRGKTSESVCRSKPVGPTEARWFCFICFDESSAKDSAYVHGWKHEKHNLTFLTYQGYSLVGSVKFTYVAGRKCGICKYSAPSSKKMCEHNSQLHLAAYSEEVVETDNFIEKVPVDDPLDCENVNDQDQICFDHKSLKNFQMDIRKALAQVREGNRIFCPSEYCCYEVDSPQLLKSHLLRVHELSEVDFDNYTKKCAVEESNSQKVDISSRSANKDNSNGLKPAFQSTQLKSDENEHLVDPLDTTEAGILEDDELSEHSDTEMIRIEVVNDDDQLPQLMKNSSLRIKCQNPGCSYYCTYDLKSMLQHAKTCPKKIKEEPAQSPQTKRIKIDHTQPGKVTYKCWMCGVTLSYRGSLQSHTYVHAKEDNNFNLTIRYSVYKGETKQDTLVIKADPNFVPRPSSNYPMYTKPKQLGKPTVSLEYDPSLPVFSCDQCNFKTNLKEALEKHIKLHWNAEKEAAFNSGNWFTCGVCYFHCFDSKTFKEHGETHKNRPVSNVRKTAKNGWTF